MNFRAFAAACFLLLISVPAQAALPSVHSLGILIPTPSGIVNSKHPDGDDGTAGVPLLWGACPSLSTTTTASDSFDLRTLCNLIEAGSPTATLSLLSGTLPTGCVMATDGIDCTTPTAGGASVTIRATRNADVADVAVSITVTTAGADSTPPTVPLGLVATDNADSTGVLSWDAASDPSVSGIARGVESYRVKKDGSTHSTVTAPSANVQPVLAETVIGASDSESSSQSGSDWTLTFGGGGLVAGGDHILGRLAQVTGDFVATAKITSYVPTSGTTGSIGIAARASTDANVIAAYARWKDIDDQCNLRYRWQAGSMANGTDSAATYSSLPVWIRLTRSGDTFSAACSSDGNIWVTTSSNTVSPGATLHVGPFITSGSAGDAATGTVAQFNLHQGASVSAPITASGSYTVSSYDGVQYSDESAAVAATVTGGGGSAAHTVPAMTSTCGPANDQACSVCNDSASCTFQPVHLSTIMSSAANAVANGIDGGDVLEFRANEVGGATEWSALLVCNGVSGDVGDPLWLTVRQGDKITFDAPTGGPLWQMTNCHYINVVGSNDGVTTGLYISDPSRNAGTCLNFPTVNCWENNRALTLGTGPDAGSSSHLAFVGVALSGGVNVQGSFVHEGNSYILFKDSTVAHVGSNAMDGGGNDKTAPDGTISTDVYITGGDGDNREGMSFCASRSVLEDVTIERTGHTPVDICGPYQVWRRVVNNGDWIGGHPYSAYLTGNHAMVAKMNGGKSAIGNWDSELFGPLIEDNLFINPGTEPEHREFQQTGQFEGVNIILRGSYMVQRALSDGLHFGMFGPNMQLPFCGHGKGSNWSSTAFTKDNKVYNNTLWGGAVNVPGTAKYSIKASSLNGLPGGAAAGQAMRAAYECTCTTETACTGTGDSGRYCQMTDDMLPDECSGALMANNLFQGVQVGRTTGKRNDGETVQSKWREVSGMATIGSYSGWPNSWKGGKIIGNLWSKHPTDPPSDTYFKWDMVWSGAGSLLFSDGVDLNNDGDCVDSGESGTWPSNFCGNAIQSAVWANGLTTPLSGSPSVVADPTQSTDPDTVRAALALRGTGGDPGVGTAPPLTRVATADTSVGFTLVLDDARWIYDGWDIDEYTWGGLHTEYADCIAVGPTATSTAAEAEVVGVSEATDLDYANHTVTIDSAVTRVDGSPVWPATRNSNGTCGTVWDNQGAAQ